MKNSLELNDGTLLDMLTMHFNMSELNDLCLHLKIDPEELASTKKSDKSRELISYCHRHGTMMDLVDICQKKRPKVNWKTTISTTKITPQETTSPTIIAAQQNTDWVGFLLDYSTEYYGRGLSHETVIEEICVDCVEAFDLQPLLTALTHSQKNVRKFAAKALGEIGGRFAINKAPIASALVYAMNVEDQDIETKRRIVWALGAIRPTSFEERNIIVRKNLRKLLVSSREDVSVRWRAAWALGELQAEGEASILAHLAKNPKIATNIRRASVRSLGVLKATKYESSIAQIANANGTKLERTAFWSLNEMRSSPG